MTGICVVQFCLKSYLNKLLITCMTTDGIGLHPVLLASYIPLVTCISWYKNLIKGSCIYKEITSDLEYYLLYQLKALHI